MPGGAILITRPAEEAESLALRISALGYRPVVAPLLRIVRLNPDIPRTVQAYLVTSSNALPSLTAGDIPLLAVGDATANRARNCGFSDVASAGRDAHALAALAAERLDPAHGPVLLASGARQGLKLAGDLRGRGFRVLRRVCYATSRVQRFPPDGIAALRSGETHATLFLSAETAAAFVHLLPPDAVPALRTVAALAIGRPAAAILEKLPWKHVSQAANPTLEDVLALI